VHKPIGALVLAASVALSYFLLYRPVSGVLRARGWSETDCRITESQLVRSTTTNTSRPAREREQTVYGLQFRYSYVIANQEYESSRYSFLDGLMSSGTGRKSRIVRKYRSGGVVRCYVDPEDPTESVLNRNFTAEMLLGAFPLLLGLVGLSMLGMGGGSISARAALLNQREANRAEAAPKRSVKGPGWSEGLFAACLLSALALFDLLASIGDEVSNTTALLLHAAILAGLTLGYRQRLIACALALLAYPALLFASSAVLSRPEAVSALSSLLLIRIIPPSLLSSLAAPAVNAVEAWRAYAGEVMPFSVLLVPIAWFIGRGTLALLRSAEAFPVGQVAAVGVPVGAALGLIGAAGLGLGLPSVLTFEAAQDALAKGDASASQAACEAVLRNNAAPAHMVPALARAAGEGDETARGMCVQALALTGTREAIPILIASTSDASAFVRRSAVHGLGKCAAQVQDPTALAVVLPFLKDADPHMRRSALEALGNLKANTPEAIDALRATLEDPSPELREGAARALRDAGPHAAPAVPELSAARGDAAGPVRQRAAEALGKLGAAASGAVPKLIETSKDPDHAIRQAVIESLGAIAPTSPAVVAALAGALSDPEPQIRGYAVTALQAAGPKAAPAVPALIALLSGREIWLRVHAAETLGKLGPEARDAAPRLRAMLTEKLISDESEARLLPDAVREALKQIEQR
jgi:HEAT repeat protein